RRRRSARASSVARNVKGRIDALPSGSADAATPDVPAADESARNIVVEAARIPLSRSSDDIDDLLERMTPQARRRIHQTKVSAARRSADPIPRSYGRLPVARACFRT